MKLLHFFPFSTLHSVLFAAQFILKRHCHAIWQLNKKLEGVFASIEFQN